MMKNTLVVNREETVSRYVTCMLDMLTMRKEDTHIEDFASDLKQFSQEVSQMLSSDLQVSRAAFRESFRCGNTMMMLSQEDMETLERLDHREENFQVAVFTEDGNPVGIFYKVDLSW